MVPLANVFNHLVLPPKLAAAQDKDIQGISDEIMARLMHATATMGNLASSEQASVWRAIRQSLRLCHSLHAGGRLEKQLLILEFKNLEHDRPLFLHVVEQNAALIVRRNVR
jgi:hypothetical protein